MLQVSLAKPVIALIGKNYHERQVNMRPNVVQVSPAPATASRRLHVPCTVHERTTAECRRVLQPVLYVVQALLEGIALCQPQPKLPSELIKYLGKSFCAWHTAIPLLESHVMIFPQALRLQCHANNLHVIIRVAQLPRREHCSTFHDDVASQAQTDEHQSVSCK